MHRKSARGQAVLIMGLVLTAGVNLLGYSSLPIANAQDCESLTSIPSNFNGNSIPAGDWIWFTSVIKLKSPPPTSTPLVIHFDEQHVVIHVSSTTTLTLHITKGHVIFDPSATTATTTFDTINHQWLTRVPASFGDNVFVTARAFQVPAGGLPGGINPVTWNGNFSGSGPFSVQWQWSAAVYTNFTNTMNKVGVKPVHSTSLDVYHNGDQAGTPENFKSFVTGGARGGGGSNWTGSYSSTNSTSFTPCV